MPGSQSLAFLQRTLPRQHQTCANCSAFLPNRQANPKLGEARQGWCRAAPPSLVQGMANVSSPLSPHAPQVVPVIQGMWPPTNEQQWCRAWEIAEDDDAGNA